MFESYITVIASFLALNIALSSGKFRKRCSDFLLNCAEDIEKKIKKQVAYINKQPKLTNDKDIEIQFTKQSDDQYKYSVKTEIAKLTTELDKLPNISHSPFTSSAIFCFFLIVIDGVSNDDFLSKLIHFKDYNIFCTFLASLFIAIGIIPCIIKKIKPYYDNNPYYPIKYCFYALIISIIGHISNEVSLNQGIIIGQFTKYFELFILILSFMICSWPSIRAALFLYRATSELKPIQSKLDQINKCVESAEELQSAGERHQKNVKKLQD